MLLSLISGNVVELVELCKRVGDDLDRLAEVLLLDDKRGCKPDTGQSATSYETINSHVHVSRLSKETLVLHQQAELPSRSSLLAGRLVDDDSVQETTTSDELDERAVNLANALAEDFSQTLGTLGQLLLLKNVEGGESDGATKRVAAVCAAVLSGTDSEHDLLAGEDAGNRVDC